MFVRFALALCCVIVSASATLANTPPASPAAGGSFQRSAVEGCTNEFLFNGVWRVKVLSVDPAATYNDGTQVTGTAIKIQVRNGSSRDLSPDQTGFSNINGKGIVLYYSDENTVDMANTGQANVTSTLLDKTLPPGGPATVTLYFPASADKTAKPVKLVIPVDPKSSDNYKHATYTVKDPSFRIHLDCAK